MSRNPGIGKNYVENTKSWHRENDYTYVINNGFKQRLPRYYKEKLFYDFKAKLDKLTEISFNTLSYTFKAHKLELTRLKNIGITNPEQHIKNSLEQKARKVKDKKNNGKDLF